MSTLTTTLTTTPDPGALLELSRRALAWLADAAVPLTGAAVPALLVAVLTWWWVGRARRRRAWRGAMRVEIAAPPRVDPAGAIAFWQHLLGLLRPRRLRWATGHVVFEYAFTAHGLSVSVWVPGTLPAEQIAAAARSAWPGARTTVTPLDAPRGDRGDRPPDVRCDGHQGRSSSTRSVGGRLRLARPAGLPLATEQRVDPLRALIGAAYPLNRTESVTVQVLARPISGARLAALARTRRSHGSRAVDVLASAIAAMAAAAAMVAHEVAATIVHGPAHGTTRTRRPGARLSGRAESNPTVGAGRLVDRAQDRAAATKAHGCGGGFTVAVRYLATTTVTTTSTRSSSDGAAPVGAAPVGADPVGGGPDAAGVARAVSLRRARAVSAAFAEFSGHNHLRRHRLLRPVRTVEQRDLGRGDALSVAEVAALAHLPTDAHVPGLRRAGAAAIAAPPQIPASGAGVRPLGDSDAVAARPVGLAVADARHHLWVLGATGAGKSTLCVHGVLADAAEGRGAVVLDPKGDLVTDILTRLPARARARTIVVDPERPDRSGSWPCLNPLAPLGVPTAGGQVGDAAVENVVSVFARVFSASWGHRSEDLFRVACLTLRERPGAASLAQIPGLLGDDAVRARTLTGIDRTGRLARFWADFDQLSTAVRAQIAAPLLNKLRAVLLRPFAEHLLCGDSTVDLPRLLDDGGLLLVRLPKGLLGEDTVRLIGSLLVAQVWTAALARADRPEHQRRDASLLIDECHNFLHLPYRIEDMLAEARGFRLSLTLAHQHLGQLTPPLRDGIAANARNKVFFTLSPDDAAALARHTLPELGPHDLANLDGFHAAARLMNAGAPTRAFTLTTRPLPPPTTIQPAPRHRPRRPPHATNPARQPDGLDPRIPARPSLPRPSTERAPRGSTR